MIKNRNLIVLLFGAALTVVGVALEMYFAQKTVNSGLSGTHSKNTSAGPSPQTRSNAAWDEATERGRVKFEQSLKEFQKESFFSKEAEAEFAELAKPRKPHYIERKFE